MTFQDLYAEAIDLSEYPLTSIRFNVDNVSALIEHIQNGKAVYIICCTNNVNYIIDDEQATDILLKMGVSDAS